MYNVKLTEFFFNNYRAILNKKNRH